MNEPTLAFACPVCGNPVLIPDSLRGRELQCPHENCGAIFQTPALDEPVTHVDDPAPEATDEAPETVSAAGAKSRRKQLPKGPGLKRKGPAAGPRPTRSATPKPPTSGDNKPAPSPAAPPAVPAKKVMGTGTKLSYLLGVVIVIGAVIYNKASKRAPATGTPPPAATAPAPATPPARGTTGGATAPRPLAPVPATPPVGKKKGKEMSEEDRNRFNESLTKADEEKRAEERKTFQRRLERAEAGSKTGQYDVGMMYMQGIGVKPDQAKAREWLDKSAAQNHPPAFNGLGELDAQEGRRDKAIALFVKAGNLSVEGFTGDDPKAKSVVYKALEQLNALGAKTEHEELAAKTTEKDKPKEKDAKRDRAPNAPASPDTPPAPEKPPAPVPPAPGPAPVLELPPLPDPPPPVELPPEPDAPPPAPAPDAPPGEIKEP